MQEKIYKWGILGPGKIARKFATALNLPISKAHAKLYAVASREEDRASAFASEYNADKYYGDYLSLIEDPAVDVIYIATPHAFHFELAKACLEHKKPVLVEKPLTLNASQTLELLQLSAMNQVFIMEALWTRFIPMTCSILEKIENGALGELTFIKADFGFPGKFDPNSRLFNPGLGGGSVLDVGIYPLFLCLLLMGDPEKIIAAGNLSKERIDLDCQAILRYKDNKSAMIASSIHYQLPITAEITGTKGQIQIPCPWYKNDHYLLKTADNDAWDKIQLSSLTNGFEYQIKEVTDCLNQGVIQSEKWPVTHSHKLAVQMDQILQQIGVQHP